MKGEPYNQTIDVYSYGVLLCEILSRTKPYSDKYTIRDYNDICDIVLDEEAIPTIPKWSGKQLEDLILKCFSRTPSNRPSFSSIIATLRAITMGSPERVYFAEFDIPRIMDGLHNQNEFLNEVVCSEIASFFQQSNSDSYCKRCGYSPSKLDIPSLIENSTLTRMALRIISYFSSKNEKLLEKSTHAFAQLLRVSGGDRISHFRSALREDGGLRRLLVYLNSTNQIIKQSASDIMIRLTNDLSSEEQAKFVDLSFLGLSSVAALSQGQRGLDRLQTVVDDELLEYKKRREELEILIAQKEKFSLTVANSREILHSKFEKESASSIRRGTLHRKEDVEILKKFQLMKKQGLELNESVLNSELNPERISASSVGDTNSEIPLTSNHCPEAFLEYFGDFKRIQFINALRWNEESFFWEPCFLFLFGHELRIYVAIDNEPDDPLFLLDLSAKENPDDPSSSSLPLVFIQDVFGKINCIKVIVQDSEFIFAFRKARDCKKWAHIINPCSFEDIAEAQASDSLEILSPLAEYSSVLEKQLSQESDYSDALLKIRNPPTAFLSENFKEYFEGMEISIYGYLCFKDIVADEWTVKFCILVNGVFRMFQSHEDEADDCQLLIYLSSTTQSEFAVPKTTDSTNTQLSGWNQQAFAVKDDASFYLFCAASTEDRERWIQAFAPNIVIQ